MIFSAEVPQLWIGRFGHELIASSNQFTRSMEQIIREKEQQLSEDTHVNRNKLHVSLRECPLKTTNSTYIHRSSSSLRDETNK
jgi:hypothetical protein